MRANFTAAGALLGALALAAPNAQAKDQKSPPPAVALYTDADAQAALDARILALKTVIRLTPNQEKLWAPVESAIRQVAKQAAELRAARAKAAAPSSFVDILERTADAEIMRAQALKTVAQALKPLVASLSDEQKRRIPAFLGMRENENGLPQPVAELWLFEEEQ